MQIRIIKIYDQARKISHIMEEQGYMERVLKKVPATRKFQSRTARGPHGFGVNGVPAYACLALLRRPISRDVAPQPGHLSSRHLEYHSTYAVEVPPQQVNTVVLLYSVHGLIAFGLRTVLYRA